MRFVMVRYCIVLLLLLSSLLLLDSAVSETAVATSSAVVAPTATSVTTTAGNESNFVFQIFGYLKDSVVRTVSGTKEMWTNHGRCKEIRAKQKEHRDKLKMQWELQEKQLTPQEMRRRLSSVNGGITYDEFIFLAKGKEDRGKLMNMMFLMWGAPKLFPYALMFYPDLLPSPFAPLPNASGKETKLEKLSRQRSHAIMQTLLNLENEAKSIPALAKLNIFGKKEQERTMDRMDKLGKSIGQVMVSPDFGPRKVLKVLDPVLYRHQDFTRGEQRLVGVPKSVISGFVMAISGPTALSGVTPNFIKRGTVLAHIQKVAEADKFLVDERVDLDSLSTVRLLEACNDRMIGGPGRTDDELRDGLSEWLNMTVIEPIHRTQQTGERFNENFARSALMGYYSVESIRDPRSASYLPRLLFQGYQHDSQ